MIAASNTQPNTTVESLYITHHSWLRNWIFRKLQCQELAADLVQDTFVKILRQQGVIQELREPRAYLSTVAKSLVIDKIRRHSLEKAYLETLAQTPETTSICEETRATIIETLVQIDKLLEDMSERTRTVFLLAQLDGLSYVEISRRLEISVNTVRKHFTRALTHCLLLLQE